MKEIKQLITVCHMKQPCRSGDNHFISFVQISNVVCRYTQIGFFFAGVKSFAMANNP